MMNLGKICNREVVVIDRDCSVLEATRLMREHHVGSLVVVDRESGGVKPIGVITDRDIVIEILAEEIPLDSVTIGDVMTRPAVTAREDDSVLEAMERMRTNGVRRMPVVDATGLLIGIISVDDMLEIISEEMSDLIALISREQKREKKLRTVC